MTHVVVNVNDFSVTSDFVRTFAAQAESGDVTHVRDPEFPLEAMEKVIADAACAATFPLPFPRRASRPRCWVT